MSSVDDRGRAEQALRRSEAEYRALFDSAGTANAEVELPSGRFVRVNRRYCELVGYTPEELLGGMTFLQVTHPDDRARNREHVGPFLRDEQGGFAIEKRYVRKDGAVVWVHVTATPIRDADGRATRLLGSAIDVTDRKRADEALRAAHATFRHMVDQSPFGVFVVDADFRLVQVSVGAQRVFANVRPLLGRDLADVLRCVWPEPFASEAIAHFRRTLETGQAYHAPGTVERRRDSGELESYDWKIERITLPDGRLGVVCHFYDLSERQRYEAALRESAEEFRAMFTASSVGKIQADLDGRILRVNAALCAMTGYAEDELVGRPFLDVTHPDDRPRCAAGFAEFLRGEAASFAIEKRVVRRDGGIVWVHMVINRVRDAAGKPVRAIAVVQDVTERRRAEALLRDADRRKDEFLATLAHELRNPLAPVLHSLELLDRIGGCDPALLEARATIRRQLGHLVRLVDDLLDVSRITRDKLDLRRERVDLAWVVRRAVEDNQVYCGARGHALTVSLPDEPTFLHADATRLVQVVGNLLNNACKYTPPGGRIELAARREEGGCLCIAVRDNGIGIAADDLARVFGIFEQVHADGQLSQGGLGIGLSLVKRLVEMHGGSVEAHSDGAGKGSEFVVRLPVPADPAAGVDRPGAAAAGTATAAADARHGERLGACAPRRVLVVDDNKDTARSMARLLMLGGHVARTAHDGPEALAAAEQFNPDLVLLDIGLPSMSGYDVCRAIRHKMADRPPVMIALTGWGQDEDRRRSAEAGFDRHLVKPIQFDNLAALLAELRPATGSVEA